MMSPQSSQPKTAPEPVRDPRQDHLLTSRNSAIVLIDFQEGQYATVGSATRAIGQRSGNLF